jgi:hypothetical protein
VAEGLIVTDSNGLSPWPSEERICASRNLHVVATTVPQLSHFRAYSGCCSADRDIAYHTK